MTSMTDHDAPVPNRPRRDPYRGLAPGRIDMDRIEGGHTPLRMPGVDADQVDPARTTVTAATGYDVRELDDVGAHTFRVLLTRHGIDPRYVAERVAVGRTRYGVVVGVTVYDHDDRGDLVVILGQPVSRQLFTQCTLDELPEQWRRKAKR